MAVCDYAGYCPCRTEFPSHLQCEADGHRAAHRVPLMLYLSQWACSPALFCSPFCFTFSLSLGQYPWSVTNAACVLKEQLLGLRILSCFFLFLPMFMLFLLAAFVLICSPLAQRAESLPNSFPLPQQGLALLQDTAQLPILLPALWCMLGAPGTEARRKV